MIAHRWIIEHFMPGSIGNSFAGPLRRTVPAIFQAGSDGNFGLSPDPLICSFGFKIALIGIRTQEDTGSDNDTRALGCSLQW
jgi:hypothetical protein